MSSIEELYQDLILDHFRHPRGCEVMDRPQCQARMRNPLCGDRVELFCRCEVAQKCSFRFQAKGCSISNASASMMCEFLEGRSLEEAKEVAQHFCDFMFGKRTVENPELEFGDAAALIGVKQFAGRIRCAVLPWEALRQMECP